MKASASIRRGVAACGYPRLCLVVLTLLTAASSAATPIYKCLDRNLGLLYTDMPCKDGERLDLRPGDADPAAVAVLERERDALEQEGMQRVADQRRAMIENESAAGFDAEDETEGYDYAPGYVSGSGMIAYSVVHRHHRKPGSRRLMRHVGPRPPDAMARR
jgi:hypothetical protein